MSLDEFHIKQAHSAIDDLAEELKQAKKELEDQKMLTLGGKILPVTDYPAFASIGSYSTPERARKEIEALYQKCLALKDPNQAAVKNNETVYDSLRKLITTIGIPSSYTEIVNHSHGRSYKTESINCNWVSGLRSLIPVQDKWSNVQEIYEHKMKEITEWEKKIAAEIENQKRIEEMETRQLERTRLVGVLANKYGLPLSANEDTVLETILSGDKYLALGHSLLLNRISWSDGPDSAADGLNHFTVESDIDIDIHDQLLECIENWDGDGRIFRDIKYGYDRLFEMADKTLLDDYKMLTERMDFT